MINPGTALDAIAAKYRLIPELVTEMDGDRDRIEVYLDEWPARSSLPVKIAQMRSPSMLIVHRGYQVPGIHEISIILRVGEKFAGDTSATHYAALRLLTDGVATGDPLRVLDMEFASDYEPMYRPALARQSLIIDVAGNSIDYWEFRFQLKEKLY